MQDHGDDAGHGGHGHGDDGHGDHGDGGDTAADWDRRYAGRDRHWSGEPNGAVVAEVGGLAPGRALDVGCGEGADAIWLARRGWSVTGVDISDVALERAREAARAADVAITFVRADLVVEPVAGPFDLVSASYPALRHTADGATIAALTAPVARGGTLLVVGHAVDDGEHARSHGFDPADYVQPDDVARALGDGWAIEVHETRDRIRPTAGPGAEGPNRPDVVLRARRT